MSWFGKDKFVVHFKNSGGGMESKEFDDYSHAVQFKKELNSKRIFAYIKKE